jgi:GGDEF domain-containing protein
MVETEAETMTVLHRAFAQRVPDRSATLLLADSSDSHLTEAMQVANGPIEGRRCSVQEPRRCPAIRHSRAQHFRDSEAVDACPHLHSEHDAAAATDPLTGLMNRRVVEERAAGPLHRQLPVAVAMADLDHFKVLNDTYGHEAGDRALRLFASTLAASLRQHDLASRYGGRGVPAGLPGSVRTSSGRRAAQVPGGAHGASRRGERSGVHRELRRCGHVTVHRPGNPRLLADSALFTAKREGRDRIVISAEVVEHAERRSPSASGG